MKNVIWFLGLFLLFLLASCKNEDTNPIESELTVDQKLKNRSIELFNQGTDVVEAADKIKKEFDLEDKVLLKSLFDAGYSGNNLTRAIHLAYDYNSRLAEPVLADILKNKTDGDIAELILSEYVDELKNRPDDLRYFLEKVQGAENKVKILKNDYEKEPAYILPILRELGEDMTETIELLISYFQMSKADVQNLILEADFTAEEIVVVLKSFYNSPTLEAFLFLYTNDYQVVESLSAIKTAYYLTIVQVSELLEEINFEVSEIVAVLKSLQYSYKQVGTLLKNHFNYIAEDTAALLKQQGATIEEITDVLIDVYDLTVPQTVAVLYGVGFSVDEIILMLNTHLSLGIQEIIDTLAFLGIDPCIILQFFNLPC